MKFTITFFLQMPGILVLFLLMPGSLSAQSILDSVKIEAYKNIADQIVREALNERKGYQLLSEICEIGPRLSGSENSLKAINWSFEKMKKLGL